MVIAFRLRFKLSYLMFDMSVDAKAYGRKACEILHKMPLI
jgi:hypothetical protein